MIFSRRAVVLPGSGSSDAPPNEATETSRKSLEIKAEAEVDTAEGRRSLAETISKWAGA